MYEGKHIHYSDVDSKPLCSYSNKLCKQRRLKGYAFCIRHVLEDKSAPFKQCEFVAKYNNLRCSNPIPQDQERKYCNSHMQVLGLVPKRQKQKKNTTDSNVKNGDNKDTKDNKDELPSYINNSVASNLGDMDLIESIINQQKMQEEKINNVSSPEAASHVNSIVAHLLSLPPKKPLANAHVDSLAGSSSDTSKPKSKVKSRTKSDIRSKAQEKFYDKLEQNKVRLHLQRQKEILERAKRLKQPPKPSPFPAQLDTLPPFRTFQEQPSANSRTNLCGFSKDAKPHNSSKPFHIPPPHLPPNVPILQARPKLPRQVFIEKTGIEEVDKLKDTYRAEEHRNLDLFPLGLENSDEEDTERESNQVPVCHRTNLTSSSDQETKQTSPEISRSDFLKQLKSQVRKNCLLALRSESSKREQASERASCVALAEATRQHVAATTKLLLGIKNQLPKREKHRKVCHAPECCYEDEDGKECGAKSLPFATHCFKHIAENQHQQLFYQCTGIQSDYTQCKNTAYIIDNECCLCDFHASVLKCQPKPRRPRKKTKPSALTRPFKKKKKKQQKTTRPQKPVPPLEPLGFEILSSLNLGIDTSQLSPAPDGIDGIDASDIAFNLDAHAGLPIDTSDLQIDGDDKDMLENNDFVNLLPKLQADDLTDIFGVKMFGGKNGDFLPTTEEQEELELALLQASNDVTNAKASLDQFSFAMMSDQDSNSSQEESMNQGDPNELPSDLQAAATRLMEDTLRQNSLNGLNTMQLGNSFPSNSFSPNTQGTLPTTQGTFNAVPGMMTVPRPLISPAQGKDGLVDTTLLTNGLNQANTTMLNLQRQFSAEQSMSPHTSVSPHQLLNQHNAQFANQLLQGRPLNQTQTGLLAGQLSAPQMTAAANQILMQNFRMPWNALTSNASLVQPASTLSFMNQPRGTMHSTLPGFSPTFPSKVSLPRQLLPDIQERLFTPSVMPQNTDQPQANFVNPSVIQSATPMVALSSPSTVPHITTQGGS